ncbi:MAG: 4-(cytidine 5'-diphospho)-2-C-methyl-D-erythritol kinase [Clostridiales bacterium]|nr:4-(cytidine 5'-diphospho)-2-C-methyl-D-erythritol kinase [Clostridiales bacterium]
METDIFKEKAYAKVNLTLDVLNKRQDGYHELEGIMQAISLADEVEIRPSNRIAVFFDAPVPENNTCKKAAELFLAGSGLGAEIRVKKRIPSEAGLGGASADAAAVLRALNRMCAGTRLERSENELLKLGLKVGADVPFCLTGGCAVARGVGEKLSPVRGMELHLLLVRGKRGVSTGKLFSSLGVGSERTSRLPAGNLENALSAIEKKDAALLAAHLANALTPAAETMAPEIGEYVSRMKALGALGASMTGSGAAVFGIFPDENSAKRAYEGFADCDFRTVCRTK